MPVKDFAAQIAAFIIESGYFPASVGGWTIPVSQCNGALEIGVLWDNPNAPPRTYLWGLISVPALFQFVAIIWIENPRRGATEQNLVVGYYGDANSVFAQKLATSLAVKFSVNVRLFLEGHEVRSESINWGYLSPIGGHF